MIQKVERQIVLLAAKLTFTVGKGALLGKRASLSLKIELAERRLELRHFHLTAEVF